MDNEYYQIEAVFDVAMTIHNFERGNLYIQSELISYKQGVPTLTVARSGFLEPKGSFLLTLNELIRMIPFSGYFFSCAHTEQVKIKIFEKFDNGDFGLQSMNFLVPNEALQFKSAHLRVKSSLYGVRWLMQEWFFTFATIFIISGTFSVSVALFAVVILLKHLNLLPWL